MIVIEYKGAGECLTRLSTSKNGAMTAKHTADIGADRDNN